MRLLTTISHYEVIILVDSGSTHNFMDYHLMKKLPLPVGLSCKLKMMVANRVQLTTQGVCRLVLWEAQGC